MSGLVFFGKLPSRGDFLQRGLAAEERAVLDDWLSTELAAARQALGTAFETAFDAAAPWHFAWRDGDGWTAGAIAPSMDAVGRRFPFLLAWRHVPAAAVAHAAMRCEEAIYAAVRDGPAGTLPDGREPTASGENGPAPREGWWRPASDEAPEARLDGRLPRGLLTALLRAPASAP